MKKLSFAFLIIASLSIVSCGNKNESGSTQESYINNSGLIEIAGTAYLPADQQSVNIVVAAVNLAINGRVIQPVNVNGASKWRARIDMKTIDQTNYNPNYQNPNQPRLIQIQAATVY